MDITLNNCGVKYFESDIVVSSEASESAICKVTISRGEVDLYPGELDDLISALEQIRDRAAKKSMD